MAYPCGYGLAVMSFTQMILLCALGACIEERVILLINFSSIGYLFITIFIQQNDELADALYSDLLWYHLPADLQKDVANMINHLQNGATLTIGPFEILNWETAALV